MSKKNRRRLPMAIAARLEEGGGIAVFHSTDYAPFDHKITASNPDWDHLCHITPYEKARYPINVIKVLKPVGKPSDATQGYIKQRLSPLDAEALEASRKYECCVLPRTGLRHYTLSDDAIEDGIVSEFSRSVVPGKVASFIDVLPNGDTARITMGFVVFGYKERLDAPGQCRASDVVAVLQSVEKIPSDIPSHMVRPNNAAQDVVRHESQRIKNNRADAMLAKSKGASREKAGESATCKYNEIEFTNKRRVLHSNASDAVAVLQSVETISSDIPSHMVGPNNAAQDVVRHESQRIKNNRADAMLAKSKGASHEKAGESATCKYNEIEFTNKRRVLHSEPKGRFPWFTACPEGLMVNYNKAIEGIRQGDCIKGVSSAEHGFINFEGKHLRKDHCVGLLELSGKGEGSALFVDPLCCMQIPLSNAVLNSGESQTLTKQSWKRCRIQNLENLRQKVNELEHAHPTELQVLDGANQPSVALDSSPRSEVNIYAHRSKIGSFVSRILLLLQEEGHDGVPKLQEVPSRKFAAFLTLEDLADARDEVSDGKVSDRDDKDRGARISNSANVPLTQLRGSTRVVNFVVLMGLPGSGKSTFAEKLELLLDYEVVNQDLLGNRDACVQKIRNLMPSGEVCPMLNILVDRCNVSKEARQMWIREANRISNGSVLHMCCVYMNECSLVECVARVRDREGHPTIAHQHPEADDIVRGFASDIEWPAEFGVVFEIRDAKTEHECLSTIEAHHAWIEKRRVKITGVKVDHARPSQDAKKTCREQGRRRQALQKRRKRKFERGPSSESFLKKSSPTESVTTKALVEAPQIKESNEEICMKARSEALCEASSYVFVCPICGFGSSRWGPVAAHFRKTGHLGELPQWEQMEQSNQSAYSMQEDFVRYRISEQP